MIMVLHKCVHILNCFPMLNHIHTYNSVKKIHPGTTYVRTYIRNFQVTNRKMNEYPNAQIVVPPLITYNGKNFNQNLSKYMVLMNQAGVVKVLPTYVAS